MRTSPRFPVIRNLTLLAALVTFLPYGRAADATSAGTYTNPVLAGDYADPTIVKVGDDFYMTHSSFRYAPGLLIW
jgi:beta-xylosidase